MPTGSVPWDHPVEEMFCLLLQAVDHFAKRIKPVASTQIQTLFCLAAVPAACMILIILLDDVSDLRNK